LPISIIHAIIGKHYELKHNFMKINKTDLPKSQMELIIELSHDELMPYLEDAAREVSTQKKIEGFRPGKAPLDVVLKQSGEMYVYQIAASKAIDGTIDKALAENELEIIDQPKIEVQKLAPNNPFTFKATVALVPNIELCDLSKIKIKPKQEIKIEEKEITKVLADLQKMRAKETLTDKKAEKEDKVELNFNTFVDNVPIEGGQAQKHQVVLGSNQMIPGFEDNLLGLSKDEEKEFKLNFPKEYHAKHLAGKEATFKIKVTGIYKVEMAELNDEFGKELGLKDLAGLKSNVEMNIKNEKEQKENQRIELDIINELIEKSTFEELPDVLIEQETHKMLHELEENLSRQSMKMEDYLKHLKKTESELRLDFTQDGIKRVKTGLLIRHIAKKEKIQADPKDVDAEVEKTIASYKMHPQYSGKTDELEKNLNTENARHYFSNVIINRKTVQFLKDTVLQEKK